MSSDGGNEDPGLAVGVTSGGAKALPFRDDRSDAHDFVARFDLFLRANPTKYTEDGVKIANFLLLLQGKESKAWAARWIRAQIKEEENPPAKTEERPDPLAPFNLSGRKSGRKSGGGRILPEAATTRQ